MVMLADRRSSARNKIDWPVSVYCPHLSMFINARSVDVSRSGAMINLPYLAPIRPGQVVELNFPRTATLAKVAGCFSRIKTARVIRVQPQQQVGGGKPARQLVAVHFDRMAAAG
ncbi:MAG: hypothetical protein BIFFINMI_01172 [Phycisphaerae bacterium]|nr:hypothetical protein [Phycisphaerae bacterium]